MLQKTTGMVLHTLKYTDALTIVDIYTELCGRASFIVPVSRSKKTGTKPGLFQPLALIEFEADFRPAITSLYRMKEVKSLFPFATIPYNPFKSAISLFLGEFLFCALREEVENRSLFAYLKHSIIRLDEAKKGYANFHLVFLIYLSRFLGLYPNLENYRQGDYFDMLNGGFTSVRPLQHSFFVHPEEASLLPRFMHINYETMHLFQMKRTERIRCLTVINDYYRLHLPGFPELKSIKVLQELFD
ncbi:DNA repair protein RecO [termite gut metagenome]|jgi:DNA repair protein RecO (recombination protein O)|uniref:DNA repair protein RecO n=1 Tax=termite gut metagenome TaxID=433724 RepID=A0A5J4SL54_9ZZZZ